MSRKFLPSQAPGQAATAPSRMLSDGSGTTEDSLTAKVTPTPWQCGQAPAGVLAENASESSRSAPCGVGAHPGEEHPQRVRQRGDGADRRARRAAGPLLLQGDRRRQPGHRGDAGDTGLLDQPTGVRGDRLQVAPLRLREDRAEGQRRLARAGDAGERDHRVAGEGDVDVAQVVLAGAPDLDEVRGGAPATGRSGSAHADEVDDEDQRLARADDAAGAAVAVREVRRDDEPAATADLHARRRRRPSP